MAFYTFVTDDGERVTHRCLPSEFQREIVLEDGRVARHDIGHDARGQSRAGVQWATPVYSTSAGVNPKQIPEMITALRRNGFGADEVDFVRKDTPGGPRAGTAILKSRAARRRFLKFRNMCDNDGGYGDG